MIIICPHCGEYIEILEINCAIFRHGALVKNGEQINPHLCKEKCDELFNTGQISGCGKPFRLVLEQGIYIAIECEYM